MKDALEALLTLPVPLIVLLVLGLLLGRRSALGRGLVGLAALALVAFSLPLTADWLERPLAAAAPRFEAGGATAADMILVPTAGIYADPDGGWWPSAESVRRAVAGRALQRETGLPLVLIGGSPDGESESEALTVAREVGLLENGADVGAGPPPVLLETAARDSFETARAAALIAGRLGAERVVLVTAPTHVARMAAALRAAGLAVSAAPSRGGAAAAGPFGRFAPLVPSVAGLARCRAAAHEYLGILWYLLNGRFALSDLGGGA